MSTTEQKATVSVSEETVRQRFTQFCQFGDKSNSGQMDGKIFSKLCKDTGLQHKNCTPTDVDLTFARAKPKGGRKLEFKQFLQALVYIAEKRFPTTFKSEGAAAALQKVYEAIAKSPGPVASGTKAEKVRFHDDKTTYTGVYARGGPTNVDNKITLSNLADRTPSDARGLKKTF